MEIFNLEARKQKENLSIYLGTTLNDDPAAIDRILKECFMQIFHVEVKTNGTF